MTISEFDDLTWPGPFRSTDEIREANRRAGNHFFDPDTMRSFGSRVLDHVYAGRVFVTSEKDRPWSGGPGAWNGERRYTIRVANNDGTIRGYDPGGFGGYNTARAAQKAAGEYVERETAKAAAMPPELVAELDAREARGECEWFTITDRDEAVIVVIAPGRAWAEPRPPRLYLTPAEAAEWAGLADDLTPAERVAEHTGRPEMTQ